MLEISSMHISIILHSKRKDEIVKHNNYFRQEEFAMSKDNNCKIIIGSGTAGDSALVIETQGIAYRIDKYVSYFFSDDSKDNNPIIMTNETEGSFSIYATDDNKLVSVRFNLKGHQIDPTTNKYVGSKFSGSCFVVYHMPSLKDEYRIAIFHGAGIKFASIMIKCKRFAEFGIDIFPLLTRFLQDIVQAITNAKYVLNDTKILLEQMKDEEGDIS